MLFTDDNFCHKIKRICLSSKTIGFQLRDHLPFFQGSREFSMDWPTKKKRPARSVDKTSLSMRDVWGSRSGPVKSNTMSPVIRHRCDIFPDFGAV